MNYSFLSPQQVIFGWGRRAELPKLAASIGRRAFFISGSRTLEKSGDIPALIAALQAMGLEVIRFDAPSHEPEIADVDALTDQVLAHRPNSSDLVIAIGGGSTIDLAKAVAAMTANRHGTSVKDFLEGVGRGLTIDQPPLPMIAVPTTAGTGSEATKNSVISSYDPPFKKSLRSDRMVPRCVLIDPELTVTLPATTTAYTGLDAITQLIESYISRRSAPIPRALCEQGLELALPAIRRVVADGSDRSARTAMSHAAFLSGLALANSGLGLAHGVAAVLGVQCRVPHGLACAVMLPAALRFNRSVRQADLSRLARRSLGIAHRDDEQAASAFIEEIDAICHDVRIPTQLKALGVRQDQLTALVAGSHGNSLSGNPRDVSDGELRHLLESLW